MAPPVIQLELEQLSRSERQQLIDWLNNTLLTTTAAAAASGVSAQKMWRLTKDGTVPTVTVAGVTRIWPDDVPARQAS